jgi:hypothetical protein
MYVVTSGCITIGNTWTIHSYTKNSDSVCLHLFELNSNGVLEQQHVEQATAERGQIQGLSKIKTTLTVRSNGNRHQNGRCDYLLHMKLKLYSREKKTSFI